MFCFFFYFIGPIFPPDFRFGTKSRQFSEDASAYWGWDLEEFLLVKTIFFFLFKKNLSAGPRELRHGACRCYQFIHGSCMDGLRPVRVALRYLVQSSPTPFSSPPLNPSSWLRSVVVLLTFLCAREKFEKINQHESWRRRRRHTRKKKKLENHHSGRFRC